MKSPHNQAPSDTARRLLPHGTTVSRNTNKSQEDSAGTLEYRIDDDGILQVTWLPVVRDGIGPCNYSFVLDRESSHKLAATDGLLRQANLGKEPLKWSQPMPPGIPQYLSVYRWTSESTVVLVAVKGPLLYAQPVSNHVGRYLSNGTFRITFDALDQASSIEVLRENDSQLQRITGPISRCDAFDVVPNLEDLRGYQLTAIYRNADGAEVRSKAQTLKIMNVRLRLRNDAQYIIADISSPPGTAAMLFDADHRPPCQNGERLDANKLGMLGTRISDMRFTASPGVERFVTAVINCGNRLSVGQTKSAVFVPPICKLAIDRLDAQGLMRFELPWPTAASEVELRFVDKKGESVDLIPIKAQQLGRSGVARFNLPKGLPRLDVLAVARLQWADGRIFESVAFKRSLPAMLHRKIYCRITPHFLASSGVRYITSALGQATSEQRSQIDSVRVECRFDPHGSRPLLGLFYKKNGWPLKKSECVQVATIDTTKSVADYRLNPLRDFGSFRLFPIEDDNAHDWQIIEIMDNND